METVCRGKQWDVLLAQQDGTVVGALPYLIGSKLGMRYILQPELTQYSGPVVLGASQQLAPSYAPPDEHFRTVCIELTKQLESLGLAYYCQHFAPTITDWLPFHWAGYHQTTRYTYRLPDISDLDALFSAFHSNRRKRIRRFEDSLKAHFGMSPDDFARFHVAYWRAKGKSDLLGEEYIAHVCRQVLEREQGVIGYLTDAEGKVVMARFVAYDERCAYSLMSAYDVERHQNGHSELLMWHLLQWLSGRTHSYDFEGSMDAGIGHFYEGFGAQMVPFFQVEKCSSALFRLLLKLKNKS